MHSCRRVGSVGWVVDGGVLLSFVRVEAEKINNQPGPSPASWMASSSPSHT
jgi:hypothetical protein